MATGLAALAIAAMALLLAPRADAAFTTGKCEGDDIIGRGASFARDAHKVFNFNFPGFCAPTGVADPDVAYEPQGSGAGRRAVKRRDQDPRFGMSDDPPDAAEVALMNSGIVPGSDPEVPNADPGDDGQIHVVPAAVGAVAPLVNFPNDCDVDLLPAAAKTDAQDLDGDTVDDDVIRVRFTKVQFEGIWSKEAGFEEWDEVFPELAADGDCNKDIIRVVRFDESGTTFAFKDYLNTIDGGEGWITTYAGAAGAGNRAWPEATFGAGGQCGATEAPGSEADTVDQLTSACASGNDDLTAKLVATDGSVGYSDISTARNNNPSLAIEPEADDNDTYWTQIPSGPGAGVFQEPTADPDGFRTDGLKGSNCQFTDFQNVPASTLGDWGPVSGVNSAGAYAVCTMTYGLVFDDNADVWGNNAAEERKARTVKDYWQNALSDLAQGQLFGSDYSPLPPAILALSRVGINAVDFNKGTGGGGGGGGGDDDGDGGGDDNDGGGNAPPPARISNRFSVPRTAITRNGLARVAVRLPGAGRFVLVGRARVGRKVRPVGRVVLNARRAGRFVLTLRPRNKGAQRILRKRGRLRVVLQMIYRPNGGTARTSRRAVVLKFQKRNNRNRNRNRRGRRR